MDMGLNNMQEIQLLRRDVIASVHGIEQKMQRAGTATETLVGSVQGLSTTTENFTNS